MMLPAGGVARGVVIDPDGKPLQRVSVSYRVPGNPVGFYGRSPDTDERGEFQNDHLPLNATIEVSIGKDDYVRANREITLTAERREVVLEVKLMPRPRGGSIAGLVSDKEGKPISNATVSNPGNRSSENRTTTTDDKGRFQLDDLYENYAGHELVVTATGFAPIRQKVEPGSADHPPEVVVVLPPGHSLRGRVVDAAGQPIPAAYVGYNGGYTMLGQLGATVRSNDEGLFEFDSMPEECQFAVSAKGFSTISNAEWQLDRKEPITVVMEPAALIRGRVSDFDTSEPIKNFTVQLGFTKERQPGDAAGSYRSSLSEPGEHCSCKCQRPDARAQRSD